MLLTRRINRSILLTLGAGFTLAILFLLASGYVSLQILDRVELRAASLAEQQRVSTTLIYEIQGEEAGLSSLFYRVTASPGEIDRKPLLDRLSAIERDIGRTLSSARHSSYGERWTNVRTAVTELIRELRVCLEQPGDIAPSEQLYEQHELLVNALAALAASNLEDAARAQREEYTRNRDHLQRALLLLVAALVLSIGCAIWTIRGAKQVFERLEWQTREMSRLSGHVLERQEETVRNFSRELHDDLGQTLSAIEANLVAVRPSSASQSERLEDCLLLAKDAISKVREMSQFLRPAMLDDFGLGPSLQWLAESFTQRTGVEITTRIEFDARVDPGIETHVFRIAQEALTNVARHSRATRADLILERAGDNIRLTVIDNGGGFSGQRAGGFGLMGMRERMSSSGGTFDITSTTNGVTVRAEAPIHGFDEKPAHTSIAG
jgi:signal transduction histidine kinase